MKRILLALTAVIFCLGMSQAQNVTISATDSAGCAPFTTTFSATLSTGTPVSYLWNFGNGTTSTVPNPTTTFNVDGTYPVSVTIGLMGGGTVTGNMWPWIAVGGPNVFQLETTQLNCGPDFYTWFARLDTTTGIVNYEWTLTAPNGAVSTSNDVNPNFDMTQTGTYTIKAVVFEDPLCKDSLTQTVDIFAAPVFNEVITDATCGQNNGVIDVSPSNGNPQLFGYLQWSTGDSSSTISGLAAGDYSVTYYYGNSFFGQCSVTDTFTVNEVGQLQYSLVTDSVECENDSTGAIDITITGSDGPVSFLWNDGSTTEDRTNLTAGTYIVSISDNSCTFDEVIVLESNRLEVYFDSTFADCSGDGGSLEVIVSGGQAPYTYLWSNGETTSSIDSLSVGGYSVVVTDATGCADREVAFVQVADSCTYTISGRVFWDFNGNCVLDGNDFYVDGGWVKLNNNQAFTNIDSAGNYEFDVPSGTYDVSLSTFSFPYSSPSCPASGSHTATIVNNSVGGLDFALTADSTVIDLSVFVTNGPIRPGFNHFYYIYARNFGSIPMSGLVSFTHDPLVTYQSSTPQAVNYDPVTRSAIWSFSNLLPGRAENYTVVGSIAPTVQIGTTIDIYGEVGPVTNDILPANNIDQYSTIVVGSYDPNDKQVSPAGEGPEGYIEPEEDIMKYTIRFQNTGNFPAEFVVLRDTIHSNLLAASIKPVSASHAYKMTLENNILEVTFENINLPDSASDPDGSQGFFTFIVKHNGTLSPLESFSNTAAIYFDYNAPIITNTVTNTIAEPQSVSGLEAYGLEVYPNPATGIFNLKVLEGQLKSAQVFDMLGNEVRRSTNNQIDMSGQPNGVYLLKVNTTQGIKVQRIILSK